jgi:hypothetical protein
MDAWTLARLAGHSNIKQSMTYVHPTDRSLHAAIERMSELSVLGVHGGDKSRDNAEMPFFADESRLLVVETLAKS